MVSKGVKGTGRSSAKVCVNSPGKVLWPRDKASQNKSYTVPFIQSSWWNSNNYQPYWHEIFTLITNETIWKVRMFWWLKKKKQNMHEKKKQGIFTRRLVARWHGSDKLYFIQLCLLCIQEYCTFSTAASNYVIKSSKKARVKLMAINNLVADLYHASENLSFLKSILRIDIIVLSLFIHEKEISFYRLN